MVDGVPGRSVPIAEDGHHDRTGLADKAGEHRVGLGGVAEEGHLEVDIARPLVDEDPDDPARP